MRAGRRFLAAWGLAVAGSFAIARSIPADAPRESPRTVRYDLDAVLDAEAHVVHGKGQISWRSDALGPCKPTLRFHLYLNAFRDEHRRSSRSGAAGGAGASTRGARAGSTSRRSRCSTGPTS